MSQPVSKPKHPGVSTSVARRYPRRYGSVPRLPFPEKPCSPSLLGIPREIRVKILKHLLVLDDYWTLVREPLSLDEPVLTWRMSQISRNWSRTGSFGNTIPLFKRKRIESKSSFYLNILRVCKQLYTEGRDVFHQQNRFITVSGQLEIVRDFTSHLAGLGNFKRWSARVSGKIPETSYFMVRNGFAEWWWKPWEQGRLSPLVRLAAASSENERPPVATGELIPWMEVHLGEPSMSDSTALVMAENLPYICQALYQTLQGDSDSEFTDSLSLKFHSKLSANRPGQTFHTEMIRSATVDGVNVWEAYTQFLRTMCAMADNVSFGDGATDPETSYLGRLLSDWTKEGKSQDWQEVFRSNLVLVQSLFDRAEQSIVEGRWDRAKTKLEFLLSMLLVIFDSEVSLRNYVASPTWTLHQTIFQTYVRIAMLPTQLEVKMRDTNALPTENYRVDARLTRHMLFVGIENLVLAHVSPAIDWPARISLRMAQLGYAIGDDQDVFEWLIDALSYVIVGEMIVLMDPLTVCWASAQTQAKQILLDDGICAQREWRTKKYNHRRARKRQIDLVEGVIQARYGPLMRCVLPFDWLENACEWLTTV